MQVPHAREGGRKYSAGESCSAGSLRGVVFPGFKRKNDAKFVIGPIRRGLTQENWEANSW